MNRVRLDRVRWVGERRKERGYVPTRWWKDDDQLLTALGDALRGAEEVPRQFIEAGKAVYGSSTLDIELAALVEDSATRPLLAGTRAESAAVRTLTFATGRLSIHIEVTNDALHGQVVPAEPGEIELEPADQVFAVDEVGWFVVQPVPTGSFRLRYRTDAGATVVTDWVTL
jgi:hypothetical protein